MSNEIGSTPKYLICSWLLFFSLSQFFLALPWSYQSYRFTFFFSLLGNCSHAAAIRAHLQRCTLIWDSPLSLAVCVSVIRCAWEKFTYCTLVNVPLFIIHLNVFRFLPSNGLGNFWFTLLSFFFIDAVDLIVVERLFAWKYNAEPATHETKNVRKPN